MANRLDKLLIARSQLLTAIDLHFDCKDAISVHTLAGAASEIIESLCRSASVAPFTEHIRQTFPEKTQEDIWRIRNLYRNAFKHADRDDSDVIAQFKDINNDFMIYVASEDYLRLRKKAPVPIQVFQVWFGAVHEDRLFSTSVDKKPYREAFPSICSMSRKKQKHQGKMTVARFLADEELLADLKTEPIDLA